MKHTFLQPRKPDFVCRKCKRACFIEEEGYAFGHDFVPIICDNCGESLGEYDTTGYTKEHWTPWQDAT